MFWEYMLYFSNQWRDEYSPIWGLGVFEKGRGRFTFHVSSSLFIFY